MRHGCFLQHSLWLEQQLVMTWPTTDSVIPIVPPPPDQDLHKLCRPSPLLGQRNVAHDPETPPVDPGSGAGYDADPP